jgi:hypothetical protein
MAMFRTFVIAIAAVLATSGAASAEPPKPADKKVEKAPDKTADKTADKAPSKSTSSNKAGGNKAGGDKNVSYLLSDEEVKRVVEFFDKLVATVVANKDDCAKMASAVTAHLDANKALLKEIADARTQHRDLPSDVKDTLARRTAQELSPAMMSKCRKDRQVHNAFTRMRLMTEK